MQATQPQRQPAQVLPDLPMEWMLSGSALEEIRAMQAPRDIFQRNAERRPPEPEPDLGSLWSTEGIEGADLGSLWSTEGITAAASEDAFDIEFGDEAFDFDSPRPSGGGGVRFRVDRPPPPPRYPIAPRAAGAVIQDGDYVGRGSRQQGMTIAEVRAAARQGTAPVQTAPVREAPARAIPMRSAPAPKQEAPVYVPTLRDRLIGGKGPLD